MQKHYRQKRKRTLYRHYPYTPYYSMMHTPFIQPPIHVPMPPPIINPPMLPNPHSFPPPIHMKFPAVQTHY